jgi:hypothetical protein
MEGTSLFGLRRCKTCGERVWTGWTVGLCGTCTEDLDDRDQAAGMARINRRRHENGLPPLPATMSTDEDV